MKINKILPVVLMGLACQSSLVAMASRFSSLFQPATRNAQRFYSGLQRPYIQPAATSALPVFNRSTDLAQRTFIDIDPNIAETAATAGLFGTILGAPWIGSRMLDALRSRYYLYKAYNARANPNDYDSNYIRQLAEKAALKSNPNARALFAPGSSAIYNKAQDILRETYTNRTFGRNSLALNASNMKDYIEAAIDYANEGRLKSGKELIIPEEVLISLQTIGKNGPLKKQITEDIASTIKHHNKALHHPKNLYKSSSSEEWSNDYHKNKIKILEAMQEKINQASTE